MKKILLLSSDHIVNDLYLANFSAYLDAEVVIKTSYLDCINFLESENIVFDGIVCISHADRDRIGIRLYEFLRGKNLKTSLFIIGKKDEDMEGVVTIDEKLNLPLIVKTLAKTFNITADQMADTKVPSYYPIPINMISQMTEAICDVFDVFFDGDGNKSFKIVIAKGEKVKAKTDMFTASKLSRLYVESHLRLKIINFCSGNLVSKFDHMDDLDGEEQIEMLEGGFDLISSQLSDLKEETQENIKAIADNCVSTLNTVVDKKSRVSGLLKLLMQGRSNYLFTRLLITTHVTHFMISKLSWGNKEQQEKLSYVLFFHDVFLATIANKYPHLTNEESMIYSNELSDHEKDLVLNHASMGAQLIRTFKNMPIGADILIAQHHGIVKGVGFTNNYKDDISPLAKVMIIAEAFVEEYLEKKFFEPENSFDPDEVIEGLLQKFHRQSYHKIVETLRDISL